MSPATWCARPQHAYGQPRYTLHQLRHTRGTAMIKQRYPLHVVQKTLGHLDPPHRYTSNLRRTNCGTS